LNDPETRQAYLPVWFPEDTGVVHKERVPCTLGYHFIQRMGYLHCTYYIRSCDFVRHFRDDLYLSLRLQLWMLNQLQSIRKTENFDWQLVKPGMFVFHCVSMHCFENDYPAICEDY
jgi:thymidylate synthase